MESSPPPPYSNYQYDSLNLRDQTNISIDVTQVDVNPNLLPQRKTQIQCEKYGVPCITIIIIMILVIFIVRAQQ